MRTGVVERIEAGESQCAGADDAAGQTVARAIVDGGLHSGLAKQSLSCVPGLALGWARAVTQAVSVGVTVGDRHCWSL